MSDFISYSRRDSDFARRLVERLTQANRNIWVDFDDIAPTAEFVFVLRTFKHPDLKVAATICDSSDHDLVVRTDRGLTQPQDLKGKRVAITRGSSGEFFLHSYLVFNRIPVRNIDLIYRTPSELVQVMADGTADAALSWPPWTTQMAQQLGPKVARWPSQSGQPYYLVLLAKEGFLKRQPKKMEQFLAAIADARYELVGAADTRRMWSTFVFARQSGAWKIAAIRNMLPAK